MENKKYLSSRQASRPLMIDNGTAELARKDVVLIVAPRSRIASLSCAWSSSI